jgi:threonine/homoserine/homoserine lactone efflux protein
MPAADTLAAFFGLSLLLALAPGPDNLFVLVQSALRGPRAGMLVVLGLCTGLLVHTAAVAAGLAALLAASPAAFKAIKFCGAAYLAWLAWQAFRTSAALPLPGDVESPNPRRMYLRGIVMNVTNPKVALFFLAFLPQFVHGGVPVVPQILWLGAVFITATLLVFGAIAFFSGAFGRLLQRTPRAQQYMNRAAGVVFLGLAARLAAD